MSRRMTVRPLAGAVLLALLISTIHPQPAFADEGAPPPDDPAASETAPAAEAPDAPAEEAATTAPEGGTGTPVPDELTAPPAPEDAAPEAAVTEGAPADVAPPAPEAAVDEAPLAEALADLPEGTTVAVVDAAGEPVPLVSDEAEAIAAVSDPVWCPASLAAPTPNAGGCSGPETSMANLVSWLVLHPPSVDGVIWIQSGVQSDATTITLDGTPSGSFGNMGLYRLTLRGGWDGMSGSSATTALAFDADAGTFLNGSEFNVPLHIINWHNDVTLMDILVADSIIADTAIEVGTTGKVTLMRVGADNNAGTGAAIDNDSGAADVAVTSGFFGENDGDGLNVSSRGMITLVGVLAWENAGYGAYLDNQYAATAKNVVLTSGDNQFNGNSSGGLYAISYGAMTIKDLTANGNDGTGAHLIETGTALISLTGVNIFAENGGNGLEIDSHGAVTASNLVADLNGSIGAVINNSNAATPLAVTLTGSNEFKYNESGLSITSMGAITVNNLTATDNDFGNGATLYNNYAGAVGDVKLTGSVVANNNYYDGLEVGSYGAVALANVTASGNGQSGSDGYGVYVENYLATSPKAITLTGSGTFNDNYSAGLYAVSKGLMTLSKITASGNGSFGTYLNNTASNPATPQAVTLSVANVFNDNGDAGLSIATYGPITIANLTAGGNASTGASLDNYGGMATRPNKITLTGLNTLNSNAGSGLETTSLGAIAIANLHALWNGSYGAYLRGNGTSASTITLSGTNEFAYNGFTGLDARGPGNLTVADVDAYNNGADGLYLDNAAGTGNISVGTSRSGWCNGLSSNVNGLVANSRGTITLSNMCIGENGLGATHGYGATLYNSAATSAKAVVLKGSNSFNDNYLGGLVINSTGAVTANNLTADGNTHGEGVEINNTYSTAPTPQNVTLTGVNEFSGNDDTGLDILTYGVVTLNNLTADGNGSDGIVVDNRMGTLPRALTINGYSDAYDNGGNGIVLDSKGAIKVTSLNAWGNGGYGAGISNGYTGAAGGVTILGAGNNFYENGAFGLNVTSRGAILANTPDGVDAWDNGTYGAMLDNSSGTGGVTLTAATGQAHAFTGSLAGDGLLVYSKGAISLSAVSGSYNAGLGVVLDNTFSGTASPQNVTIKNSGTFIANDDDGLSVDTYGAIAVANLTAHQNGAVSGGYGADLDNYQDWEVGDVVAPRPVTLTGTNVFESNPLYGLRVRSLGAITASNLSAYDNGGNGAYLDNQWGDETFPAAAITLSGTNTFEANGWIGLEVYSNGAIRANSIAANFNEGDGAYFDTWGWWAPQSVTLTGTNVFTENGDFVLYEGDGLRVWADGAITVSNLTATDNAEDGAYLDNEYYWWTSAPYAVTVSGVNAFTGNVYNGLNVLASGAINLSNVTADENGTDGVVADSEAGSITLSCASLLENGNYGFNLTSPLSILLKGVHAFGNVAGNATNLEGTGTLATVRSCP